MYAGIGRGLFVYLFMNSVELISQSFDKSKGLTFPVRMITPTEASSLASLKARISSFMVWGLKAFLLSGLLIVICINQNNKIHHTHNTSRQNTSKQ